MGSSIRLNLWPATARISSLFWCENGLVEGWQYISYGDHYYVYLILTLVWTYGNYNANLRFCKKMTVEAQTKTDDKVKSE